MKNILKPLAVLAAAAIAFGAQAADFPAKDKQDLFRIGVAVGNTFCRGAR